MNSILVENHEIHRDTHIFTPQKIKSPHAEFIDYDVVNKLIDGTHPSHVETVSTHWGLKDYRINKAGSISIQQLSFFNNHDKSEITVHRDAWAGGNNIFVNIEHSSARGSEAATCGQEILHIVESVDKFKKLLNETMHKNVIDILTDDLIAEFDDRSIDIHTVPQADIDNTIRRILQYQPFSYKENIGDIIDGVNQELSDRNIRTAI